MTRRKEDAWLRWHTATTVWLELSSWRGVSFGAIHYYGTLQVSDDYKGRLELKRTLTISDARELTKLQNDNSLLGLKFRWNKGDQTRSFDTEDDVITLAKKTYQEHFPKAKRLVLGSPLHCEPDKLLNGAKP